MIPARVVVTGIGMCSALGLDTSSTLDRLRAGETGIRHHPDRVPGFDVWAGLLTPEDSALLARESQSQTAAQLCDRTAQLGTAAGLRAMRDAQLDPDHDVLQGGARLALVLGTSHGGRSQLDAFVLGDKDGPEASDLLLKRAAHHFQTAAVASALAVHGPVLTISSACGSSGVAIAYGLELLRSQKADVALVGGADAFSRLTYAGFSALGAMADGPCGPFSSRVGMTLGEGAAFLVLERVEQALARRTRIRCELLGHGSSWDAYHLTEPEPSGAGISRALGSALRRAELPPQAVGWFHAHGTGTRANDAAECLAITRQFDGERPSAPVVSSKSFTGHTLGASSALGFAIAALSLDAGLQPPTANFQGPRPGCELDFVPNRSRPSRASVFALNSAAFGGANVSLIAGRSRSAQAPEPVEADAIVISGIGVLSGLGVGLGALAEGLASSRTGISSLASLNGARVTDAGYGGLVRDFDLRKLVPTLDARRSDRVMQYGLWACREAMQDSGLLLGIGAAGASERTGLFVGTCRGAVTSFSKYLDSVAGGDWKRASATHFPNLVMSSIGGFISRALGVRGIASTVVGAGNTGLAVLAHALELFRRDDSQDALVVVVADQLEGLFVELERQQQRLAPVDARLPALYASRSSGALLGEGAVAVVLERKQRALARGVRPYAVVAGSATTHDADPRLVPEPEGRWLARAISAALVEADVGPAQIDAAYGHGCGDALGDAREIAALLGVFGEHTPPIGCVTGHTGLAEASAGLFGVAAACLSLRRGVVYPLVSQTPPEPLLDFVSGSPRKRDCRRVLVTASGRDGGNAAVVLEASA